LPEPSALVRSTISDLELSPANAWLILPLLYSASAPTFEDAAEENSP